MWVQNAKRIIATNQLPLPPRLPPPSRTPAFSATTAANSWLNKNLFDLTIKTSVRYLHLKVSKINSKWNCAPKKTETFDLYNYYCCCFGIITQLNGLQRSLRRWLENESFTWQIFDLHEEKEVVINYAQPI